MKKNQQGFSLIELLIVVVIIGIIAAIAIPSLLASRRASNESAGIGSLRTMTAAQTTYRVSYPSYTTNLVDLQTTGIIDSALASGTKTGYTFDIGAVTANYFDLTAIPQVFGTGLQGSGSRSFAANESGTVFFNNTAAAPTFDPATRAVATGAPISN